MTLTPRNFDLETTADLDTVWRALTTADGLASWYVVGAEVDLEPGGKLSLDWGAGEHAMGTFETVDPPTRLKLVYATQDGEPSGAEEWLLSRADGVTHVRLVHSLPVADGTTWDETYPGIVRGWRLFLGTLGWLLDTGHEPDRTSQAVIGPYRQGAWPAVLHALGLDTTPPPSSTVTTPAGPAEVLVAVDDLSLLMSFGDLGTLLVDVEGDSLYTVAAAYGDAPAGLLERITGLATAAVESAGA